MTESHFGFTISKNAIKINTVVLCSQCTIVFTDFLRCDADNDKPFGFCSYATNTLYVCTEKGIGLNEILCTLIHELTHMYDFMIYENNEFAASQEKLPVFMARWGRQIISDADKAFAGYLSKKKEFSETTVEAQDEV